MPALPTTLQEAFKYFSDPDICLDFATKMRWPDGVECPNCGSKHIGMIRTRQKFQCKNSLCRKQFSVKVGTIMEDSPLGLDKWFIAMWMIANCKNGVSSYEIARTLGITQKSAWFLDHRIRLAMREGTFEKIEEEAEVDETFIGGKARTMHKDRWEEEKKKPNQGKSIVLGVLDRKNRKVAAKVIKDTTKDTLTPEVQARVKEGATVYTDGHHGYDDLTKEQYLHLVINHAVEYVFGNVHTNGIENFWTLLKRTVKGTYICPEEFHLFRYLDEQTFRYNYRKLDDYDRFALVAGNGEGKRVTYKKLTGKLRGKGNLKNA